MKLNKHLPRVGDVLLLDVTTTAQVRMLFEVRVEFVIHTLSRFHVSADLSEGRMMSVRMHGSQWIVEYPSSYSLHGWRRRGELQNFVRFLQRIWSI